MTAKKVYVFGLEGPPEGWPEDLEPVGGPLPREEPVVVPLEALGRFRAEVGGGPTPAVILLVPAGAEAPAEAAAEVDEVVGEGDWDRLRELLACPRRWAVSQWVQELSREDLFRRPETALPGEVRAHLAQCQTCRAAFLESLRARRRLARLFCPDVGRLAAFARGEPAEAVERHLKNCPLCRAEVAALQRFRPKAVLVDIPLPRPVLALAAAGEGGARVWAEAAAEGLRVRVTVDANDWVWVRLEAEDPALAGRRVRVRLGQLALGWELAPEAWKEGRYEGEQLVGHLPSLDLGEDPHLELEVAGGG